MVVIEDAAHRDCVVERDLGGTGIDRLANVGGEDLQAKALKSLDQRVVEQYQRNTERRRRIRRDGDIDHEGPSLVEGDVCTESGRGVRLLGQLDLHGDRLVEAVGKLRAEEEGEVRRVALCRARADTNRNLWDQTQLSPLGELARKVAVAVDYAGRQEEQVVDRRRGRAVDTVADVDLESDLTVGVSRARENRRGGVELVGVERVLRDGFTAVASVLLVTRGVDEIEFDSAAGWSTGDRDGVCRFGRGGSTFGVDQAVDRQLGSR